jgi:hypothetical protein
VVSSLGRTAPCSTTAQWPHHPPRDTPESVSVHMGALGLFAQGQVTGKIPSRTNSLGCSAMKAWRADDQYLLSSDHHMRSARDAIDVFKTIRRRHRVGAERAQGARDDLPVVRHDGSPARLATAGYPPAQIGRAPGCARAIATRLGGVLQIIGSIRCTCRMSGTGGTMREINRILWPMKHMAGIAQRRLRSL